MSIENNHALFADRSDRAILKKAYESKLWEKAAELEKEKKEVSEKAEILYLKFQKLKEQVGLHSLDLASSAEEEYWHQQKHLEMIREEEDQIQKLLEKLDDDSISLADLKFLYEDSEEKRTSKRKKAILEELQWQRLHNLPDPMETPIQKPQTPHLTTGRHAKKITTTTSLTAEKDFYFKTADTHGGKVGYGKKADSYTTKDGKRIRKS